MKWLGKKTVLVIPDLQIPFHHKDSLKFLKTVNKQYLCDDWVCIGDEIDFHAMSDYTPDPDGMSPGDELRKALNDISPFYKAFPNMKVCTSNHTDRPFRKAYKFGIPKDFIRDYHEFLEAPKGWEWRDDWVVDNIRYEHGHGTGGGRSATYNIPLNNAQSTVFGHFHSFAGIQYLANPRELFFGFNVGCLIDRHTYAFNYGKRTKTKPILGCGVVDRGIPIFIPMLVNSKNRWVGKI